MTATAAPTFSLPDQDGKKTTLATFKGKWTVLYFYPKDDTPGCTTEACDFTNLHQEFASLDAKIVGVSPDSPESHRKFIDKYNLELTLLSDPEKETLLAYGAWGLKKNYGKEYEGVIRSTIIIDPESKIAHSFHNVRAKGHAERVHKKMKELRS